MLALIKMKRGLNESIFGKPLFHCVDSFTCFWKGILHVLLLFHWPFESLLVVHVGIGSFPDGIMCEKYLSCQVYFILYPLFSSLVFAFLFLLLFSVILIFLIRLIFLLIEILKSFRFHWFIKTFITVIDRVLSLLLLLWLFERSDKLTIWIIVVSKLWVGEDVIRLLYLCKFSMTWRIDIRMMLFRKFKIWFFDGLLRCILVDLQYLVVIFMKIYASVRAIWLPLPMFEPIS